MNKLDIVKGFGEKRVLLIGDTILDIYSYSKEVCKSSDSQAIEIEEERTEVSFGGASLIANNILELGGSVVFFSVIGDDEAAKYYDNFVHPKLNKNFIIDKTRPTIVKKRYWVENKKILQVNQVNNRDISSEFEQELLAKLKPFLKEVDLIVVLDARHGLLTQSLISKLVSLAQEYQKPLYVDSQISHRSSSHHFYRGADCLFLNQKEAQAVHPNFDIQSPEPSLNLLKQKLGVTNVVVKLGEGGSLALFNNKYIKSSPHQVKMVDPCGAGDAFLAAFSLGDREAPEESLVIANTWAALSTTIFGTKPPKKQDLIKIYG